jgi:hypothetical protein
MYKGELFFHVQLNAINISMELFLLSRGPPVIYLLHIFCASFVLFFFVDSFMKEEKATHKTNGERWRAVNGKIESGRSTFSKMVSEQHCGFDRFLTKQKSLMLAVVPVSLSLSLPIVHNIHKSVTR